MKNLALLTLIVTLSICSCKKDSSADKEASGPYPISRKIVGDYERHWKSSASYSSGEDYIKAATGYITYYSTDSILLVVDNGSMTTGAKIAWLGKLDSLGQVLINKDGLRITMNVTSDSINFAYCSPRYGGRSTDGEGDSPVNYDNKYFKGKMLKYQKI